METIVLGVISGIVASAIVFVIQLGYLKILRPWAEELLYRDLKIEGQWMVQYPDAKEDFSETVELSRSGHTVTGLVTVTGGPDKGRIYHLTGTFKNLILTTSFSGKDERSLDRGCFTVQAQGNGQDMVGYTTYYQDDTNAIASLKCTWKRA